MKRIMFITAAAILLAFASVGAVQAAKPTRILATPSMACSIMVQYHAGGYQSFGDCMGQVNEDIANYRFPDNPFDPNSPLLSLSQRCTQFEEGIYDPQAGGFFQITYPFFFGEGGPEAGWPFPELTAQNHRQCGITLYTYHTLASLFGG